MLGFHQKAVVSGVRAQYESKSSYDLLCRVFFCLLLSVEVLGLKSLFEDSFDGGKALNYSVYHK